MTPPADHDAFSSVVSDGENVLLLGPSRSPTRIALRRDISGSRSTVPDLLVWVTFDQPSRLLDDWDDHIDRNPWAVHFVTVGTTTADAASELQIDAPPDVTVEVAGVRQMTDLTGIGIEIVKALSGQAVTDAPVIVYFGSITPLQVVNDRKRVYRFLHILLQRLRTDGAVGVFHLDPAVHDRQTTLSLTSLFDTVVEFGDDE